MDKLIYEGDYSHILTEGFCKHVINKFEADDRKRLGAVGDKGEPNLDVKTSIDFNIACHVEDYGNEVHRFMRALQTALFDYNLYLRDEVHPKLFPFYDCQTELHSGFQIQRTDPGGFYTWHSDEHWYSKTDHDLKLTTSFSRGLTYIFYLNDVHDGGYTEFVDGTRIQPETGKCLIFPATWSYLHRGCPPVSEQKWIATGWMYGRKVSHPVHTPDVMVFPGIKWNPDPRR